MKKSLIALAVLAAAGSASAQSSVTLFGIIDATLQIGRGNTSDALRIGHSGYNSSRLGFRGTEDLGGGMSASFWLEAGVSNDSGEGQATSSTNQVIGAFVPATGANAPVRSGTQGLTFNRRSTVSLAGGWGEVRIGRDYTPQFWNLAVFEPFGFNGVGTTQTAAIAALSPVAVRASNSIGYFLPGNLGGFYGQIQYYLGENAQGTGALTEDDGNGAGIRVGYAAGPVNVAVAFSRTDYAGADVDQNNIGAQWDFGFAKLMGHYAFDEIGAVDADGWLIGALVPMGAGEIRVSYSTYEIDAGAGLESRARKLALGYVHNLSKRTALYATYARVNNNNLSAVGLNGAVTGLGQSSSGFDLGVRHSF